MPIHATVLVLHPFSKLPQSPFSTLEAVLLPGGDSGSSRPVISSLQQAVKSPLVMSQYHPPVFTPIKEIKHLITNRWQCCSVLRMISWESDCFLIMPAKFLYHALRRTRRLSVGTSFASQMKSQSSPCHLPFISALSTDPSTHGLPSMLMGWQTTGLLFTERPEFVSVLLIWWPTQRYFSKASTACINYYYNQENPNKHHFKKPTEAISSSLNSGSACYLTFPHLQSCLHFTSNYFSITSFSIMLPTRA